MSDDRTCLYCGKSLEGRPNKKHCDDACRLAAHKLKEQVSESNLYPPVLQKWRESGFKDLRHFINVVMGGAFGIAAELLERYKGDDQ